MCKPCTNCLAKPRKNSKLTLRVPNDFDDGVVFSRSHLCADFFLLLLHVILFNCKFAYSNQQHNKKICSHQLVALLLRCSCLCTHLPLVLLFLSSSHAHFYINSWHLFFGRKPPNQAKFSRFYLHELSTSNAYVYLNSGQILANVSIYSTRKFTIL